MTIASYLYSCSDDLIWIRQGDGDEFRDPTRGDIFRTGLWWGNSTAIADGILAGLTNFSSSRRHVPPLISIRLLFIRARRLLISSYAANCILPLLTPTRASREPLYSPLKPSVR